MDGSEARTTLRGREAGMASVPLALLPPDTVSGIRRLIFGCTGYEFGDLRSLLLQHSRSLVAAFKLLIAAYGI